MHGNSFQRKLAIVKNGGTPTVHKPKRRTPYGGRSNTSEKPQRSRSLSSSPDRVRPRGRSPAFNALAANFETPNARNLSTPPPMVRKIYPKSVTPDSTKLASRSAAIAALTASFDKSLPARQVIIPSFTKGRASTDASKPSPEENSKPETIQEDVKEGEVEDDDGLRTYPYDRLKTTSTDLITVGIDVTKREAYLSSQEFREKFGMNKDAFYKLPKWKQNKLKMTLQLF
nr:villin-4-like [Ipomoea batatas]GMC93198.1 villin-4-like [Ipomoea batatas]GMC94643.1 villin-4-like [Ipomoea batatas]GMC98846.1 villin-4-like [Ipomoea batatas]